MKNSSTQLKSADDSQSLFVFQETEIEVNKGPEEDLDKESDNESDTTESSTANASDNQDDTRPTQTEEEDLGKVFCFVSACNILYFCFVVRTI